MESSYIESLLKLGVFETTSLIVAGVFLVYSWLSGRVHILIFILTLSAAFVGNSIQGVENLAALGRLLSLALLLLVAIGRKRWKPSPGCVLFWGYVALGYVSLFQAFDLNWQLQRCILLMLLAVTIPFVYSDRSYESQKLSLTAISAAAAAFCLLNIAALPAQLDEAARFSGFFKGAATYAVVLGGLLPFALWGMWRAGSGTLRIWSGLGFFAGVVALLLSGQRTGTIAGLIGTVPLLFTLMRRQTIAWLLLLLVVPVSVGYLLVQQGSGARKEFLEERYSSSTNLSGRQFIWDRALSEINEHPLLGRGIGASESVIPNSFHNTYLEVWCNTGLFGLFLFMAAQGFFMWKSMALIRQSKGTEMRSLGALALGYMISFVLICMFESTGAGAANVNLILYLILGVIISSKGLAADADRACSDVLKNSEECA